jgi:hypothetical protein
MLGLLQLNQWRDWPSRRASLRRNVLRVVPPAVLATVMTCVWYQCRKRGWHLPKDAEMMLGTAILVLAAIFAIAAAMVLNGTWERSQRIARYILTRNKRAFMVIRDEKLPIAMHLVLASFGLWVLILLGAAEYGDALSGGLIVFSTWFAMSLYFVVVIELQEPTKSVWLSARIPDEWLKESVDTYFKSRIAEKQAVDVFDDSLADG